MTFFSCEKMADCVGQRKTIMSQATELESPAAAPLRPNEFNLVWVDMEMTGLDPDKDRIIEVAVVVTDSNLNILGEGPVFAIHQPNEIWTAWMHGTRARMAVPA
jgi:oligoribonuclease